MKNRILKLHDGSAFKINDDEWRSVLNSKSFDDDHTEIVRVTRHTSGLMNLVYAMRSEGGKVESEHYQVVMKGGDLQAAVTAAAEKCGITDPGMYKIQ